ncbi:MAG: NAD-dependent epimerase/dehydratase family protein [Bacteroidota bacterium]
MKVFVTGATGFIGIQLVKRLVGMGNIVHALYRSETKANLIRIEGVTLFKGDILDKASLTKAMEGCSQVYHTAAFAGVWAKDPGFVYRLNVEGALNVIDIAAKGGANRIVVTSTAGILGPSDRDPVNETSPPPSSFFTSYEASKFKMEQEVMGLNTNDLDVVIVNPTRVYGPGFLSESNGVTKMIKQYIEGRWRLIPGNGESSGNYVHVEDVVTGHLLAMEKGSSGERYVLGGENISYNQLFKYTRELSGVHKRLFKIPLQVMLMAAFLMKGISTITGKPPLIVPNLVRKFNHNWFVSSDKAINLLGYDPMGIKEGIEQTISWLKSNNKEIDTSL